MAFMNKVFGETAYQQNLYKPVQTKQEEPWSTRRVMGNISKINAYDQPKAQKMYNDLMTLQGDPTSKYYNPYTKPTNKAVSALSSYGVDVSNIDDKFFADNDYLLGYLSYNGTTNTPSKPGKKASNEEKAAYEYYQVKASEEATRKVETQWEALQNELSYWANRKDRNYSDDDIINRIDWKKYDALDDLDKKKSLGKPTELNRGTTYSKDAMYAVLWAARNGGSSGSIYGDMARSANGEGNAWQFDQNIADRLNPKSTSYSPYSVGSTLDDAAVYFDVDHFDREWLIQNNGMQYGQDETARKMYQKVLAAEETTSNAEKELAELNDFIDKRISRATKAEDADKILNRIDWNKYPTLAKMDKSIGVGDMPGSGDLLALNRAVDYRYGDIERKVREGCAERAKMPSDVDYVDDLDAMTGIAPVQHTDIDNAIVDEQNSRLADATDLFDGIGTESEQSISENIWSSVFGLVKNDVKNNENSFLGQFTKLTEQTVRNSISKTSASILEDSEFIAGYERNTEAINELDEKRRELEEQYGESVTHFGLAPFNPNAVNEYGNFSLEAQAGWGVLTEDEKKSLQTMLNTAHDPSEVMDVISDVYNSYVERHQADNEAYAEYSKVVADLDNAIAAAKNDEARYNEAIEKRNDAEAYRTAVIDMLVKAGVSNEDLQVFEETNTVVDALRGFTEYEPTQWEAYNAYDLYAQQMAFEGAENYASVLAEAKAGDEITQNEIETAQWLLDYSDRYGITIPDNVRNNLNRYIAKMERNHKDFEYFSLLSNEDFKEGAEKGYEMAFDDYYGVHELDMRTVGMITASNLMSNYEQDTYYYLLATQGKEAAEEYYNHLADGTYGVLTKRNMEGIENATADLADQGFWGRRVADVASMLMSPVAALGSIGYGIEQGVNKLLGKETEYNPNNPWLSFNKFKTSSREAIQKEITEAYGEGTMLTKLATSLQEMVSNRGDSMVNALAFGWLTQGIGGSAVQELVGALPMATSAAFDAMSEAKEKGATDDQIWAIGGVTLFAESVTEAVTLSNIKEAFKAGEDITGDTIKAFLKNWLTKSGIEEAFGESINDIIENYADKKIMGELSNHAQKVKEYEDAGMSPEEAEAAARRDELSNILHTAIISYLSPGLDIVSTGAGRLNYYKQQTKLAQQAGYNVSLLDVMTADKERTRQITPNEEAPIQTGEQQEAQTEEQATEQPAVVTEQAQEASADEAGVAMPVNEADTLVEQTPEQVIAADYQLLDNAAKADLPGQTATIAAVLDVEGTDTSSDQAKAAAALADKILSAIPGNKLNAIEWMQNLWIGASEAGVNINTIKQAFQTAILGGEESAAYKEMKKGKFRKADFDAQAVRLASTVEVDAQDQAVQETVAKNVREARIVEAEGQIIASGEQIGGSSVSLAMRAMQAADKAAKALVRAKSDLEARQGELEAATSAAQQASENLRNDPSDMNSKLFTAAIAKFNSMSAVVQEYEQSLSRAETEARTSEENARSARESAVAAIRQQAEAVVAQQDQQRTERMAQEQIIAQQQAEQQAQQEIVQNEVDNSNILDADAFIEQNYADASEEEKQQIREAYSKVSAESIAENGTPDAIQRRDRFVQQVSKKFGINIEVADTTHGGVVDRQNGYYDRRNNRIVLDEMSSIDDAMFFVLGHELTHVAEASQSYSALASTLVRMKYGYNEGQLAADIRARKALYDERLARMHEQDNSIDATPLTEDEAAQEIVADIMGDLLHGDTELVNRLVAEEPSMARKIISSIKNFLRKAVGMKGAWVSDAQRTVDMLETALKDSQAQREQNGIETREAVPSVTNENGTELTGTLEGDTEVKYSLSSWTDKEIAKVRANLLKNGFTKEQADKWIADVNSIAAIIAEDKDRLDFTPDRNQKFKKPNGDVYKWTLDASTLCAKRLIYQGTFNAIQKLMPNTPLYAGDLIELSNMMRDMGYQTPCGICYVESQRRDSGKFTEEFIQKYAKDHEGEFVPTFADLTTSDGLYRLRDEHKDIYDAYIKANNARGSGSTKPVQLRTDYRGDVRNLQSDSIEALKNIGGLRINSFSDFETPHLMDMMQAVLDMAAVKLTSQAYTKVPNFAAVFGDTGIKINLSLMGEGNGVDENGKLIFSSTEGMDYNEAMALRDKYSANVGTILVGMNDQHILAAMADPTIDYIIPFHRSGWSEENRAKMTSLANYKDYQDYQNERDIKTGKKASANIEPGYVIKEDGTTDGYWDYNKSGKENAETYLDLCNEKGLIPKFEKFLDYKDGRYYLKSDGSTDGYWKLLIDFKMYENNGDGSQGDVVGAPQHEVVPNINMEEARRVLGEFDGTGVNSLPVAEPVVERFVNEYKANHPERTKFSLIDDILGIANEGEEDREVITNAVKDLKEEYDPTIYNGKLYLKPETLEHWLSGGGFASTNPNYAQAYITTMNPADFLRMSTFSSAQQQLLLDQTKPLNQGKDQYGKDSDLGREAKNVPIMLKIDENEGRVVGHEGRHRSIALARAGVTEVPVLLYDYATRNGGKTPKESMTIRGQDRDNFTNGNEYTFNNVIPLSNANRDEIFQRFTASEEEQAAAAANSQRVLQYSLPSNDLLEQQIRQYIRNGGSIANQNQKTAPAPRFNERNTGTGVRQWGNEGAQASDELFQQAKDKVLNSEYTKDTNAAELNRALDWIQKNRTDTDPDGYNESMRKVTNPSFNYRSKDGQARMIAVMALATAKDDVNGQVALADAYNKQGTALGQALQARKIWRLMTPEGRIASLRKMLSDQQIALYNKGNYKELKLSDWVYQAASYATEEGEFEKVQKAAAQELAKQLPRDWKSMFRAWRMLSMLGNPRTHIRNFIGNALFIPSVGLKNKIGALMEIGSKEKTKTLAPFLSSEARSFARADAVALKDILTGEAKYNEGSLVEREAKPFKGLLQAVIDFNSKKLEDEDWTFLKGHYRRALGGWMMANGYSADYLRNNPSVLEQGRAYAVQEAQKATYRDANKIAQHLNKISREGGALGFVVDATLPFKKTPANILRRGVEYSPAGILRSLTTDLYHLKQWQDAQKANAEVMPEKAISPTQFIDRLCSGLSGTAVMVMGALLGNMGIVSCGLDDDDDELEKAKGNQKYSFKFNIAGKDFTYTMDWAAPMSMPFFVGAAIQEQMQNDGDVDINDIVNAMGNITEPVFNLSMLDGINTLFKTSQYDDTNTLTQIGAKVVSNYVTSYVPSLLGAIARTVDDTQRKNFVKSGEGTGITGTFNYAQEQVENKIPGMSQKNIPVRDIWGNANTSGLAERIIENFFSPGYINSYKDDPLINEMARLYDITGDKGMIPEDPDKSFTYNKQKYVLEAEQWDRYKEVRGQTAYQMMTDLLKNSDYQKADAGVQTQMIKDVWSYADKVGKQAIIPDYNLDTKSVETISTEGTINGYKDEMMKALAAGDLDTYDTMVEALREMDVEDKDIKTKIANVYRDKYKEAYRKNDYEAMNEIEYLLDDSGFSFDIAAWEDQVDKKYNK